MIEIYDKYDIDKYDIKDIKPITYTPTYYKLEVRVLEALENEKNNIS